MLIEADLVHMTLLCNMYMHCMIVDYLCVTFSVSCYIVGVGVGNYSKSSWEVNRFIVLASPCYIILCSNIVTFSNRKYQRLIEQQENNFGLQKLHCHDVQDLSFKLKQNRSYCFNFSGDLMLKCLRFGEGLRS